MMVSGLRAPVTRRAMEEALVGWHEMWWRSPGSGVSPWAKDGPWSLAQGEQGDVAGTYSLTILVNEAGRELIVRKLDTPRPRTALSAAEIAARDAIGVWVNAVPDDGDRVMVMRASEMLWRGHGRVDWAVLRAGIGSARSVDGLRWRYARVLGEMVCRANGVPVRWARALSARDDILPVGSNV